MKKIKITFLVFLSLFLLFSVYSLYPVISYNEYYDLEPGRIYITDRFGKVITDKQKKGGYYKSIELDLNSKFVKSLLIIEDKDYYTHVGIDFKSKLRAFINNLKANQVVSGGSTITEQYIKNKYFNEQSRTYLQKTREAFLAFVFTIGYSKVDILNNYLNTAYFGNQIYGIGGALEVYFGIDELNSLKDEEIVILLSLLHNPSVKSLNEKYFSEYFDRVKTRLGFDFEITITKLSKKENMDKFPFVTKRMLEQPHPSPLLRGEGIKGTNNKNPYTSSPLRRGARGGKEIILQSTIDADFQSFSYNMLNETLDSLKGKNVTNGAFVVYNPRTMEVLAYEGSRDFYSNNVDGEVDVIKSPRQMGSTLKPFLYLQALQSGANIDDFLVDLESTYNSFKEGKLYISENYSLKEYGLVRFKKAIGNSLNNASVRLAKELGLEKVWKFFKDYGLDLKFPPEHYGYSLVLGNPSISLENLVLSYRNLLPEYGVDNDRELEFVIGKSSSNADMRNIDPNKYLLYNILSNPDNRDISFGVNSILNTSISQAVKTGTSSEFKDNVIVSYHPDLIVGIWIGNNDNSSMIGVSGITGAGYLWHQIIEKSINEGIISDFEYEQPKQIEKGTYCLDTNCLRQEIIYKKIGKQYKSSIIDNRYFLQDIFEKMSIEEQERLKDLKFNIIN